MTTKDYQILAAALREGTESVKIMFAEAEVNIFGKDITRLYAEKLADKLEQDNHKFNRRTFVEACL